LQLFVLEIEMLQQPKYDELEVNIDQQCVHSVGESVLIQLHSTEHRLAMELQGIFEKAREDVEREMAKHKMAVQHTSMLRAKTPDFEIQVGSMRNGGEIEGAIQKETTANVIAEPKSKGVTNHATSSDDKMADVHVSVKRRPALAKRLSSVIVSSETDTKQSCGVTGATFVGDMIVIVDSDNKKLKLFKRKSGVPQRNKLVDECEVNVRPHDVTLMEPQRIAVTFPETKTILFYTIISNKLSLAAESGAIATRDPCYGISYSSGIFAVSCVGKTMSSTQLLDKTGCEIRWLRHQTGNLISAHPKYVVIEPDNNRIYISDDYSNRVFCITYVGSLCWEREITRPKGIAVVGKNVYVASPSEHCVYHMDSESGQVIGEVVTSSHKVLAPNIISVNKSGDKLCVSQLDIGEEHLTNKAKVFSLKV
jgi:hypothetical protein